MGYCRSTLVEDNSSSRVKYASATFPTTNPARNCLCSKTGLLVEMPATNRLSHDTAHCISTNGPLPVVFAQRKTAYNKTIRSHQSGCKLRDRPVHTRSNTSYLQSYKLVEEYGYQQCTNTCG